MINMINEITANKEAIKEINTLLNEDFSISFYSGNNWKVTNPSKVVLDFKQEKTFKTITTFIKYLYSMATSNKYLLAKPNLSIILTHKLIVLFHV